jgi:peptidyl-prolyl cis-trans isomerase B (cyclophilin B)
MSDSEKKYPRVTISTSKGDMVAELWDDVAPGHVANFQELGRDGFYDGLNFHRIIPGFVAQGGCPKGDGTGGRPDGKQLKAEFNDREHVPGTLSMARSQHPDSAGSQFFVCLTREHCRHLDGSYTAFGQVVEGMDVVEALGATPTDGQDRPKETVELKGVRPVED